MPAIKPNTESLNAVDGHVHRPFDLVEEHGSDIVDDGSNLGYGDEGMTKVHRHGSFARRIAKPQIAVVVRLFADFR